jgi:predicted DNA-binding WGR domain protein
MEGATTNKFYMVFVYDNGNGVFRALGGYGGLAQNPRLFDVMTTRDQASAVAAATRKLKAKERKGYFTYRSEEGNAPIQDPMEFGEMANWTPMDGTPGLSKRKRAERYGADFEYHYNFSEKYAGSDVLDALRSSDSSTKAEAIDWLIDKGFLHSDEQYNAAYVLALGDALGLRDEEMDAENIPVWNDGIVEWETSGPMSPTGSGYSSASAPPTGVIAGPGDTFLNYTEAQNYLVETSGGLYGAEHFEAMSRIDPKNAQDVKKVKDALKQRYKGIKINRVEYITNRRGSSNKYHVFAFTDRGVFNGYGRIGKTMTIFGPMSSAQGEKKMDTKMRRGGYKEQV